MSKPPEWFGTYMAAAQHKDYLDSLPLWKWLFHRVFLRHKCPACQHYEKFMNQGKKP